MAGLYDNYVQTDNIFKGEAPSLGNYNWGSISGNTDWSQTPSVDWTGSFDLPGLSGAGGLAARSTGTDWVQKGFEALNKALSYKAQNSTDPGSRSYRGYGSNAPTAVQGRGYTMFLPTPTQKTTQSGGSKGFGGTIGSVLGAGLGLALAPATGGASAAIGAAGLGSGLGGQLGSLFG